MESRAGIWGIGAYLPENVRRNDWWPESVLARWREKAMHKVDSVAAPMTDGVQRRLAAMMKYKGDMFNGAKERRIMRADQTSSDMEVEAARKALENAQCDPSEIDAIVVYSACADYLAAPNACVVHQRLGLPER